jgi:sulfotransferase
VVEYEYLSRMPEKVLRLIYDFIGEPWYDGHDFENVEFDAPDFDEALGISGLHKVRPKVEFKPRRTILPPDLFKKFEGMDFWREMAGRKAFVIAGKREENHAAST